MDNRKKSRKEEEEERPGAGGGFVLVAAFGDAEVPQVLLRPRWHKPPLHTALASAPIVDSLGRLGCLGCVGCPGPRVRAQGLLGSRVSMGSGSLKGLGSLGSRVWALK
eukprot:3235727-Rhodomonas_salina.1